MKKFLLLAIAAIVLYAVFSSCKAQSRVDTPAMRTIKVGVVYLAIDSNNEKSFYEVWNDHCPPPPENIFIHDSMWAIPGGWSSVRPLKPPVPARDTVNTRDTLYQLLDGTFTNKKPAPILVSIFTTQTLPTSDANDGKPIQLGIKFTSSQAGFIKGIRFYKLPKNNGSHVGELYSSTGTLLSSATFTGETASGWQTVQFATSVAVLPGTTYVAALYSPSGGYAQTLNGLALPVTSGPVTGQANGLYLYGHGLPTQTFSNSNYWVDIVFSNTK